MSDVSATPRANGEDRANGADRPHPEPQANRPLLLVKSDATPEEVAALVAVVQGLAAAQAAPGPRNAPSEWSAHRRKVGLHLTAGPGGWRSSALPR